MDWRAHAARYTAAMYEDLDKLGCLRPEKEPKASEYIDEMLAMIGQLIANGYAYQASNGDVMYEVRKFAPYGKLSGKKLDDLRAGARVEVDTAKRDPLDFVLWKSAKPGEPAWPSPWGDGRPGWHIECSAMSTKELGEHFDIHGGGLDLKFPHHENEIAQTCGATHGKFAEIWMHNGFLNIDNEKMSKSLGNFFTTREVLAKIKHPEVLRFFLLSSHYRGPMNYSPAQLEQSEAALTRLYTGAARHAGRTAATSTPRPPPPGNSPPRWTTISIRPKRSPYCRDWRANSIPNARRTSRAPRPNNWPRNCGRSAACSDFSAKIRASSCAAPRVRVPWTRTARRGCRVSATRKSTRR